VGIVVWDFKSVLKLGGGAEES
jgi:hypothetical protein